MEQRAINKLHGKQITDLQLSIRIIWTECQ